MPLYIQSLKRPKQSISVMSPVSFPSASPTGRQPIFSCQQFVDGLKHPRVRSNYDNFLRSHIRHFHRPLPLMLLVSVIANDGRGHCLLQRSLGHEATDTMLPTDDREMGDTT